MTEKAPAQLRISVVRKLVLPLYLISGAAGLIYEVVWTRAFGVVFGNTIFAVSTVLTAFMLGLAGGSWLFGRVADKSAKPLKMYALLQVAIGAYAFVFPIVLAATDNLYGWVFRTFHPTFYPLSLLRFVLSVIILFVPTALMGGTLPVLSRLWANSSTKAGAATGRTVGLLYAVNTFGAVVGCFLAGYVLMRLFGVSNTIYLAASANIVVAILAFFLSALNKPRHVKTSSETAETIPADEGVAVEDKPAKKRVVVLVAVALAGFCALALEVLWTRVLVFVLGTSVFAFACMLTCFIFGIALGSLICSRLFLRRIRNPVFTLGVVEFLIPLSVLLSIWLLGKLWYVDFLLTREWLTGPFWKEVVAHFIDALVILLLPTLLMGMAFPIAVKICATSWSAVAKRVGELYASNTIGCVAGSFAAGFVMIPLLGLRDSFFVVLGIGLFVGTGLIFFSEKRRAFLTAPVALISVAVLIVAVLFIPRDVFLKTMNTYHYPSDIIYLKDDATGTVTVHDLPDGDRFIVVDGVDVAGVDLMLRTTQKLQGYVPLLLHSNPKKVLQIGFGSGETSRVGLAFGVEQYNIVEICPAVFEAGKFFEDINKGSYKDPRLRKIIMDGKNFVKLTDEKFDIIMNDSTYPGTTGSSALYTYDHFRQCREHLTPDGVLSCWVPLDLQPKDFQLVIRSFQKVCPHCSLWILNNCLNKHAVLLGTLSPMKIDFQRVKKLVERPDVFSDLADINIHSAFDLLDCLVVDEEGLKKIAGTGPLNTDDNPSLEFGAAIKRDTDVCLETVLSWITQNHCHVSPHVVNLGDTPQQSRQIKATLQQYYSGTNHALRGLLGILQGDPEIMNHAFELARKVNPQDRDIESCLAEITTEIKALIKAVKRRPGSIILRSRLAKRYLLLRDYEKAAEQYTIFLKLRPDNPGAWNNLGLCYKGLLRFEDAVWAFRKAIEYDPVLFPAYINLGDALRKLGNFNDAVASYEKARSLTSGPQQIFACDKLAQTYYLQKDYSRALIILTEAIKLAQKDSALYKHLLERRQVVIRAAEGKKP